MIIASIRVHAFFRGHLIRREFFLYGVAATEIQKNWRGLQAVRAGRPSGETCGGTRRGSGGGTREEEDDDRGGKIHVGAGDQEELVVGEEELLREHALRRIRNISRSLDLLRDVSSSRERELLLWCTLVVYSST